MRAVALADPAVQQRIAANFIPLKVTLKPGAKELPLDWPALGRWRRAYALMGGESSRGFTGCTVISPDLEVEYADTGGAMVWELFDSIAYDAQKFAVMLDRAQQHAAAEQQLRQQFADKPRQLQRKLRAQRRALGVERLRAFKLRMPPEGFTKAKAMELFRLSGDLKKEPTDGGK